MRWLALVSSLIGCAPGAVDLDGHAVDPTTAPAAALLFVSPGCPIANRYAPEIARIAARFSTVRWWLVYPDASPAEARAHLAEYGYALPALLDRRRALARRARVEVTPEAALFSGGRLFWHGRIDDRFADVGHQRPAATRHDLEDALAALVAGRAPPPPAPAVGCVIERQPVWPRRAAPARARSTDRASAPPGTRRWRPRRRR